MEEAGDPHFKRERPAYGQPPPLHMPPADAPHLHNYHPAPQAAQMPQSWNPAPSPYHDGHDHRPPPADGPPPHQAHPSYPPTQNYGPPPPPSQTPTYPPDIGYSRQNSVSGTTRSPPSAHPAHYPGPANGAPDSYYAPPDYRNRPQYVPPESPANAHQHPPLHVQTTGHEMMPVQSQQPGPPPAYPPQHPAGPPPTPGYWAAGSDWYQARRKPVRAAQACDPCRQRKSKCDELRPECGHCKDNSLRCTYRDVPPQKSEKQMIQMSDKVDKLADILDNHNERFESLDFKLDDLLTTVRTLATRTMHESRSDMSIPMVKQSSRPQTKEEPRPNPSTQYAGHQTINAPFMSSFDGTVDQSTQPVETLNPTPSKRGPTGASDLLLWPAIRELVPKDIPVSYVMDGEVQRGLLRLYGCGEGEDKGDGHDGAPSPAASNSSSRMDEDGSTSTSSPSGVWGTGQLPSREGNPHPVYDHPGGVTPSGELLLDRKAVDEYVKSYLDRMHILHPFLDPKVLRKMVHNFKLKHSWDYGSMNPRVAQTVAAGSKRKRDLSESPGSTIEDLHAIPHYNGGRPPVRNSNPIEHSVSHAIILLVLALGKICAYEKSLPGPPKSSSVTSSARVPPQQQPLLGYSDLPPMLPASSAPASPYTAPHTNGISLAPTTSILQGKNMDVIPGLAYYAKAADILGELPGGVDVSHVQANLLAGLYMGQLARILPSHWYIANACKACQILIRSPEYTEKRMTKERRNLVNFAFWSCLQLESDILAEMDIPASGIIEKEGMMLLEVPNALTIMDPEQEKEDESHSKSDDFLRHYSNQIQLRRTINDAVHNIYNNMQAVGKPTKLIEVLGQNLESWRKVLGNWDWKEDEHESSDINHARMRGKYYGAKYIINRPALNYALSLAHPATPMNRPSESPLTGSNHSEHTSPAVVHHNAVISNRRVNEMRPPTTRGPDQLDEWILALCRKCVEAAIKSTTAFDKVPARLVITNILGTAHAQFGNVLVLAATFNSPNPDLRSLVPEETLRFLLSRTIRFLDDKASISPALGTDAKILRYTQNKIFPSTSSSSAQHPVSANSSFSSNR